MDGGEPAPFWKAGHGGYPWPEYSEAGVHGIGGRHGFGRARRDGQHAALGARHPEDRMNLAVPGRAITSGLADDVQCADRWPAAEPAGQVLDESSLHHFSNVP
ncbi:hypothetical protein GCM10020220_031570 [Nonomuraea rubra]